MTLAITSRRGLPMMVQANAASNAAVRGVWAEADGQGRREGSIGAGADRRCAPRAQPALLRQRVLWIDDEPAVIHCHVTWLESQGLDVTTAVDVPTALALARTRGYDVMLLDEKLGRASGVGLLRALRADGVTAPVIMVSAFGSVDLALRAGQLGVTAFFGKPFNPEQLLAAIVDAARPPGTADMAGSRAPVGEWLASRPERHPYVHWADTVVGVIRAEGDLRSEHEWAKHHGISVGGLRLICARARIAARPSLLLARLLRATTLAEAHGDAAEQFLDIADPRTFRKWMSEAGLEATDLSAPRELLRRQRLVPDARAVAELMQALDRLTAVHGRGGKPPAPR